MRAVSKLVVISYCAMFFLSGCAGLVKKEGINSSNKAMEVGKFSLEERVAKRAEERWEAMIKWDFAVAYQYLSPAARETMTLKAYQGRLNKFGWVSAKVKKVDCDQQINICRVTLRVHYKAPPPMAGLVVETDLFESWINDGTEVWYSYE